LACPTRCLLAAGFDLNPPDEDNDDEAVNVEQPAVATAETGPSGIAKLQGENTELRVENAQLVGRAENAEAVADERQKAIDVLSERLLVSANQSAAGLCMVNEHTRTLLSIRPQHGLRRQVGERGLRSPACRRAAALGPSVVTPFNF